MNYKSVTMLLLLSALVLTGCRKKHYNYDPVLSEIDSIMVEMPDSALTALKSINPKELSQADRMYFDLLSTIAIDKATKILQTDSTISVVYAYFSQSGDKLNHARSALYRGLLRYRVNMFDEDIFHFLKEAQTICEDNNVDNKNVKYLIYLYLGELHRRDADWIEAQEWYSKAREEAMDSSPDSYIYASCYLVDCYLYRGDNDLAMQTLNSLDPLTKYTANGFPANTICLKKAQTFYALNELDSALYYCEKWIPYETDSYTKNTILGNIHYKHGNINQAIEEFKTTDNDQYANNIEQRYAIKKSLSDCYLALGLQDSAMLYLGQAYNSLYSKKEAITGKRIYELERHHDQTRQAAIREKEERRARIFHISWAISAFIVAALLLGFYLYRRKKKQELNSIGKLQQITNAAKTLASSNLRASADMINDLESIAIRKTNSNPELNEVLFKAINDFKRERRYLLNESSSELLELLSEKDQAVAESLSSANEVVMFALSKLGFSNEEISGITGYKAVSVRSKLSKIYSKIPVITFLLFIAVNANAQPKGNLKARETPSNNISINQRGIIQTPVISNARIKHNQDDPFFNLVNVPINDNNNLFFNKKEPWIYLGWIEYRKKEISGGQFVDFPYFDGRGLLCSYPEESSVPEYYHGDFKRGSKHGNGVVMQSDSTFYAGVWQWDKFKESSLREATDEEIAEFKHQLRLLDMAISIAGRLYNPKKE